MKKKKIIKIIIVVIVLAAMITVFLQINRFFSENIQDVGIDKLNALNEEIDSILFEQDYYLKPDRAYLAKLELLLTYGDIPIEMVKDELEQSDLVFAYGNILINIKKGYRYNRDIQAIYLILEDAQAPYMIINGELAKKEDMIDVGWEDICRQYCNDTYVNWREAQLYYAHTIEVFSVYRKIVSFDWRSDKVITGYMVVSYDKNSIISQIEAALKEEEFAILYNETEDVTLTIGTVNIGDDDINKLIDDYKNGKKDKGIIKNQENKRILYSIQEKAPSLYVIVANEDTNINELLRKLYLVSLYVIVVICIVIIIFYVLHYKQYRSYITGLVNVLSSIDHRKSANIQNYVPETNIFPTEAKQQSDYESIANKILKNLLSLNEIQEALLSEQELRTEIEMLFSHAQINSHFLLNSIDYIYWSSVKNNGYENEESVIIERLGTILKYALDSSSFNTRLSEEIRCAKAYIDVQRICKDIDIESVWDISENLYDAKVEKLILQPILENSVSHGVTGLKRHKMQILIKAFIDGDELNIQVSDDGIGMDDKSIEEANALLAENKPVRSRHIGLANINRRIKIQYGNNYGLELKKSDLGGLCVSIKLKYSD